MDSETPLPKRFPIGRKAIIIDLLLTAAIFLLFWKKIIPPHNPLPTGMLREFFSIYSATAMTCFFWLFWTLFRITYEAFKRQGREGPTY